MSIVSKSNRKLQFFSITVLGQLLWVLVYPAAFAINSIVPESLNLDAINISQQHILKQFSSYAQKQETLDQNGWSVLTPSKDSRLIYVSASRGNDKNGKIYNRDQITNINSPGEISEFKSIQAALKHLRPGYADHLLLRRGDTWLSKGKIALSGGRSAAERMVLMS